MDLSLEKVIVAYNSGIEGAKELAIQIGARFSGSKVAPTDEIEKDATFVIVVGGDGTLLKCARFTSLLDIPVFGFNMGRLGFLAQAMPNEIDFVAKKIKDGDFRIENRSMLYCPTTKSTALNDIVIKGATYSRTSTLKLKIGESELCSYLADGLIISTPTGSTAYSLSAGGPIISPELECFVVVPICPHTLNARPIVVSNTEKLTITTHDAPKDFQLTSDGQDVKTIKGEIKIEKFEKSAKLLLLNSQNGGFYDVLREKLYWGKAPSK